MGLYLYMISDFRNSVNTLQLLWTGTELARYPHVKTGQNWADIIRHRPITDLPYIGPISAQFWPAAACLSGSSPDRTATSRLSDFTPLEAGHRLIAAVVGSACWVTHRCAHRDSSASKLDVGSVRIIIYNLVFEESANPWEWIGAYLWF